MVKNIAQILGYRDTFAMSRRLSDYNKNFYSVMTKGGLQNTTFVTENGLLESVLLCTKLPQDKKNNFIKELKQIGLINHEIVSNSRKEIEFLYVLEKIISPLNISIEKQKKILNYRIDAYIPELKIAIEYDENSHCNYSYESHEGRQIEIENILGCEFIRVSDNKDDYFNIGIIMKYIFKHMKKYNL